MHHGVQKSFRLDWVAATELNLASLIWRGLGQRLRVADWVEPKRPEQEHDVTVEQRSVAAVGEEHASG